MPTKLFDPEPLGSAPTIGVHAAPTSQPELPPAALFAERYEVHSLLGRGGMGVVYRARDTLVGEDVALKLLGLTPGAGLQAIEGFRREVRLARKVTHPNVVRIHDLDSYGGQLFISMEFVEGGDLRALLLAAEGPIDPVRAAQIAREVADALGAAHAVGVIHRDLKPENVLVEQGGRFLLSDFGISSAHDGSGATDVRGLIIGTPMYMAPEQVTGDALGPATDVYALGVVLFEMLTGRPPFTGDDPIKVAVARLHDAPPDPRSLAPVPEPLASLIDRCLARSPAARPASGAEVARELSEYLEREAPVKEASSPGRRSSYLPAARTLGEPTLGFPVAASQRALACLSFAYRGPDEHAYLGDAISGELIDILGRTRGLRVLSSGAVARVARDRDPVRIARELAVDFVVDGSVQYAGGRLRIVVRLVDGKGTQLASERFDIGWGDIFEVQEQAARRIAESLRIELTTAAAHGEVPAQAIELYLRARRGLRAQQFLEAPRDAEMLEQALAVAPAFGPALAAHALAAVHIWFFPNDAPRRDWEAVARASVERALTSAPDLSESHVAAARLASHGGDLRAAVAALRRAVDIAPTSSDAHHLLGQLECETGRVDEGLKRLAIAFELEPTSGTYPYERGRAASFAGDHTLFDTCLGQVRKLNPGLAATHLSMRHAAWWRDAPRLRSVVEESRALGPALGGTMAVFARAFLGEVDPGVAVGSAVPVLSAVNPRFGALIRQILIEIHASAGDDDGAMDWLHETASGVLYDLAWLERCPLLVTLRGRSDFADVVGVVRSRSDAVWRS